jgi:hypothetical protein
LMLVPTNVGASTGACAAASLLAVVFAAVIIVNNNTIIFTPPSSQAWVFLAVTVLAAVAVLGEEDFITIALVGLSLSMTLQVG